MVIYHLKMRRGIILKCLIIGFISVMCIYSLNMFYLFKTRHRQHIEVHYDKAYALIKHNAPKISICAHNVPEEVFSAISQYNSKVGYEIILSELKSDCNASLINEESFGWYKFNSNLTLKVSLAIYNSILHSYRIILLSDATKKDEFVKKPADIKVANYNPKRAKLNYFDTIRSEEQVTFFLKFQQLPIESIEAFPIREIYQPFSPNKTCEWDEKLVNSSNQCYSFIKTKHVKMLKNEQFLASEKQSSFPYFSFLHILQKAFIDQDGAVYKGGLDIVPSMCKKNNANRVHITRTTYYEEVFTIAQFWGEGYFHANIESSPRIAPFIDFLIKNKNIKIHVKDISMHDSLHLLGFHKNRFISGNIRANIVYIPHGNGCGTVNVFSQQLMHYQYQKHNKYAGKSHKKTMILIQRRAKRYLADHGLIAHVMASEAQHNGYEFQILSDSKFPPMNQVVKMFQNAALIVAPHGAGLANLQYAPAGTNVIEILCNPSSPGQRVFHQLAMMLGQRYFSLLSVYKQPPPDSRVPLSNCGPMKIDIKYFKYLIHSILKQ